MQNAIKHDAHSHAHRTTIAAPPRLLREAAELGRRDGLSSLNAVVQTALEEYVERRRRAAFAASIAEMARDPDIVRESAAMSDEFSTADADGII